MKQAKLRSEALQIFGENAFTTALFYQYEGALRFELSGEGSRFDQFLQALRRSEELVEDIFSETDDLHVCISGFFENSIFATRPVLSALAKCEIKIPETRDIWGEPYNVDLGEEDGSWYRASLCFSVDKQEIRKFLWGALSADLDIKPALMAKVYLYSPAKKVLVHPYDDRGMDVIGSNPDLMKDLYRRYNDWLLEYDRKAMDAIYSPV